jgi:hypothetical protein
VIGAVELAEKVMDFWDKQPLGNGRLAHEHTVSPHCRGTDTDPQDARMGAPLPRLRAPLGVRRRG